MKIAIAGIGTVGGAVLELLTDNADIYKARTGSDIYVTAVSARTRRNINNIPWYENPLDIVDEADVVIELMGGADGIALELARKSLSSGRHFVTANKAMIARHGSELSLLATKHNVSLMCEAAVAGGIPVIKALREGLAANKINMIAGVLNGTCNYILTTMEKSGRDFADVLKEAQDLGYAEADPTFDIDGIDTAQKLSILAGIAFGIAPADLSTMPIDGIRRVTLADMEFARLLGYRIKLLGVARQMEDGFYIATHPAFVKSDEALAGVDGAFNAVEIMANPVGKIVLEGRGAGGGPTASAVIADVLDIVSGRASGGISIAAESSAQPVFQSSGSAYYLRLTVIDKPGVVAEISSIMRDNNISIESLNQRSRNEGERVNIFMTLHKTSAVSLNKTLDEIQKLASVIEKPFSIRIVEV